MKLYIDNFAKIKTAEIVVDGITVIAGDNDTGKSTIGKILFSLFNAISGIESRIAEQRKMEIHNKCQKIIRNYFSNNAYSLIPNQERSAWMVARSIGDKLDFLGKNAGYTEANISNTVRESLNLLYKEFNTEEEAKQLDTEGVVDEVTQTIQEILNLPDAPIIREILSRYFREVFHKQIQHVNHPDADTELKLEIKDKQIELAFMNNECESFSTDIALEHKAIYIDDPFVADKMNQESFFMNLSDDSLMNQTLAKWLRGKGEKSDIIDGVIGSVLAKEKQSAIYDLLQSVVQGTIIRDQTDEFYLKREGMNQNLSIQNLSTGLKSFLIIQRLLDGVIGEKDVLILDEPEIHLHPQWQLIYAELIVLLQKQFDLSILVTTHSPYFLDAINLYSIKHGIDSKVNYYSACMDEDAVKMENVTNDLEAIYKKMAAPFDILDTLRDELQNR